MQDQVKQTESQKSNLNIDTQLSKARKSTKNKRNKSVIKKKQCSNHCRKHNLELQPLVYSSYTSKGILDPIKINFCSKGNSTTVPLPMICQELRSQVHVPLFILDEDIKKYEYYLQEHQKQFRDAVRKAELVDEDEGQQILVAIPKTKNCQVCKIKIQKDQIYTMHINSTQHKNKVRESLGYRLINQQTEQFQRKKIIQRAIQRRRAQMKKVANVFKQMKRTLKGLMSE